MKDKESSVDLILNSIFFLLLGFLLSTTVTKDIIKSSDIASIIIAITAVYGVLKWKEQIDYKEKKEDEKMIIRSTKEGFSRILDLYLDLGSLIFSLERYKSLKKPIYKDQSKKHIDLIREKIPNILETSSRIEAEIAKNTITRNNPNLQKKLHIFVHSIMNFSFLTKAIISDLNSLDRFKHNEIPDLKKIRKDLDETYDKFSESLVNIEEDLGTENSSKAKFETLDAVFDDHSKDSDSLE